MDGLGSEVSHKIKAAITAKLVELGAYVDDELPDYIMVMVANKRTKTQMDDDLKLFLNNNTKVFTSWLHTVLQKLQEVTVAGTEKPSKRRTSTADEVPSKKNKSEDRIIKKQHKKEKKNKKDSRDRSKEKSKNKSNKKKHKEKRNERSISIDSSQNKKENRFQSLEQIIDINIAVGKTILDSLQKKHTEEELKSLVDQHINKEKVSPSSSVEEKIHETKMEMTELKEPDEKNKPVQKDEEILIIEEEDISQATTTNVEPTATHPSDTNDVNDKQDTDSERSLSPGEIRKQLLLSRAKKELETSKLANRMKSNSPEVTIIEQKADKTSTKRYSPIKTQLRPRKESLSPNRRNSKSPNYVKSGSPSQRKSFRKSISRSPARRSSQKKSFSRSPIRGRSPKRSFSRSPIRERPSKKNSPPLKRRFTRKSFSKSPIRKKTPNKSLSPIGRKSPSSSSSSGIVRPSRQVTIRDNPRIIKDKFGKPVSIMTAKNERRQLERNRSKSLSDRNVSPTRLEKPDKKTLIKETFSKKGLTSRIVTLPDAEEPEISSIIKVKPRQYVAKEKQANNKLILKAVAAAEMSVSKVIRTENTIEEKKSEGIFTKDLRNKRYEKIAVTLPNVRSSEDELDDRAHRKRRVSVNSYSDGINLRADSTADSDLSDTGALHPALSSKKSSTGSEGQFIRSKTNVIEKNDKYIHSWLEGVEKAVKSDEIVDPKALEEQGTTIVDSDQEENGSNKTKNDGKKKQKLSAKEIQNLRLIPNRSTSDDGLQIVVTFDGLKDKSIQQLISKNKETNLIGTKIQEKTNLKISDRFGKLTHAKADVVADKADGMPTESKNKKLIAQLSEKFGRVDREFENKKRKDEEKRYHTKAWEGKESKFTRDRILPREAANYEDLRRMRAKERCKYWPDCSKGTSCDFHHPNSPCKLLPNCKYKENCMYIHPKCKDDTKCTKRDCAYEHSTEKRRKTISPVRETSKPTPRAHNSSTHRFTTPLESRFQNKQCRYDGVCRNPECSFYHSNSKKRLKWSK